MARKSLVEKLQKIQEKKQSIGIWHTFGGITHFTSGRIEMVNNAGIKLVGSYFIYFEGERGAIEEICFKGKTIYRREDNKNHADRKNKKQPACINRSHYSGQVFK